MPNGEMAPRHGPARCQGGFAYLWLLFAVAVLGLLLGTAAEALETAVRREREAELMFVGDQYRRAIAAYHACPAAGGGHQFPARLEDLLEDRRFVQTRHLRRLYRDPMTGAADWGLIMAGDRITGVHSLGQGKPLRTVFSERDEAFASAADYRGWRFIASGEATSAGGQSAACR